MTTKVEGMKEKLTKSQMRRIAKTDSTLVQLEHSDVFLRVHEEGQCKGEYCTAHNRSDHSMRSFPQHFRWDRMLMERICPHGVGHPDVDEIDLDVNGRGSHGCCGCCSGYTF